MQVINGFTVLILTGVVHIVLAWAALNVRQPDDTRAITRLWIWAQFIAGATQLLRLLRDSTPAFLSSTIPNTGAALGYGLMVLALARLFQQPERSHRWLLAAMVLAHLLLRDLVASEPIRLGLLGVLFALQFGQFVLLYGAASRLRHSNLLSGLQLGNVLVVLTMLARAVEGSGAGEQYRFDQAGVGQLLALFGVFVGVALNGIGFLVILIQRGVDELHRLSTLDALTETLNRRSLILHGRQQLALADRAVHPVSVLICDIDHFKQINDRYGHHVGDDVIRMLVAAARNTMRDSDSIARWGGEEFVLLLPRTDRDGGRQLAERLRQTFAKKALLVDGKPVQATVSIGIAQHHAGEDLQLTIDRADAALLQAKQAGRDRIMQADAAPS